MSFSNLPTVVTGDLWTASNHNTFLRDNLAELWKYQAAEDLMVGAGPNTSKRLAAGANNTALNVHNGVLEYRTLAQMVAAAPTSVTLPHCMAERATSVTIPEAVYSNPAIESIHLNSHGFSNTGTGLRIPDGMGGNYFVHVFASWFINENGIRIVGTGNNMILGTIRGQAGVQAALSGFQILNIPSNGEISWRVWQNSGAPGGLTLGTVRMTIIRVG